MASNAAPGHASPAAGSGEGRPSRSRSREDPAAPKRARPNDESSPERSRHPSLDSVSGMSITSVSSNVGDEERILDRKKLIAVNSVIILQPVDKDKSFKSCNPFHVRRELLQIATIKRVNFLFHGGIAVAAISIPEARKVFRVKSLCGIACKASQPKEILNSKGVIRRVIPGVSCLEVKEELALENPSMKVLDVRRLGNSSSNTYCFTIEGRLLPEHIYLGFWKFPVKWYVASATQCYKCQRYHHKANVCRGKQRCVHCSGPHKHSECEEKKKGAPPKCCNCKGNHPSFSEKCFTKIVETKISNHSRDYEIPYTEARASICKPGISFAEIVTGKKPVAKSKPKAKLPVAAALAPPAPAATPLPPPPSCQTSAFNKEEGATATMKTFSAATFKTLLATIVSLAQNEIEMESGIEDIRRLALSSGTGLSREEIQAAFFPLLAE